MSKRKEEPMTYGQLALNRYVLDEVKNGRMPSITNNEKVDLDYLENYYNNLISDIEREKKKKPKAELQSFVMVVEVNK